MSHGEGKKVASCEDIEYALAEGLKLHKARNPNIGIAELVDILDELFAHDAQHEKLFDGFLSDEICNDYGNIIHESGIFTYEEVVDYFDEREEES